MRRLLPILLLVTVPLHADTLPEWQPGFGAPPSGLGLDGDPRALLHHDGHLYCGGSFSQAGDLTAWFVARLETAPDGTRTWASLGDLDNRVDALAAWGDSVLVGGRFTLAGGTTVNRVAVYDGAAWQPVGDPAAWTWGHVGALALHDGTPWAAGTGYVVRWTGTAWETITMSNPIPVLSRNASTRATLSLLRSPTFVPRSRRKSRPAATSGSTSMRRIRTSRYPVSACRGVRPESPSSARASAKKISSP